MPTDIEIAVGDLVDVVIISHPGAGHTGYHVTQLPCLLDQLDEAITSSMSGKAGGGSKSGRSVLNSDALYLASIIRTQIESWARMAGMKGKAGTSADMLRRWSDAKPDAGDFYLGKLLEWKRDIESMLNPKGKFEYAVPCVVCKADTWVDDEGDEHRWPLLLTYPKGDIHQARMTCRACGIEWVSDGIGELIEEVEDTPQQVDTD